MPLNRPLLAAKFKALLAHIAISLVLVGIALSLMWLRWFPGPLFATDGGGIGLKLLLLVDLVLGPLLTFVVFNPNKARRETVLDLSVIALLQLGAYGYGLWNIHSVRVQAVAFHQGVFHAVPAPLYQDQAIEPGSWQALGPSAPYVVDVRAPAAGDEAAGVAAFALTAGLEPYHLQFLYQPLARALPVIRDQGWTLTALKAVHPQVAASATQWLQKRRAPPVETLRFYRLEGYYGNAVLVLGADGQWLGGFEGELPGITSSSVSPRS